MFGYIPNTDRFALNQRKKKNNSAQHCYEDTTRADYHRVKHVKTFNFVYIETSKRNTVRL